MYKRHSKRTLAQNAILWMFVTLTLSIPVLALGTHAVYAQHALAQHNAEGADCVLDPNQEYSDRYAPEYAQLLSVTSTEATLGWSLPDPARATPPCLRVYLALANLPGFTVIPYETADTTTVQQHTLTDLQPATGYIFYVCYTYPSQYGGPYDDHCIGPGSFVTAGGPTVTETPIVTPVPLPPPATTLTINSSQAPVNNWYTSDVQLTFTASGGQGGVQRTVYQLDGGPENDATGLITVAADGHHTLTFFSIDQAGQRESPQTKTFQIDRTAPTTTLNITSGQVGIENWYGSDTQLTLAATDNLSGVARTVYQLDGGPETDVIGSLTVSTEGRHTITFFSVDNAGLHEPTQTTTFGIDRTAPTIAIIASGSTQPVWTLEAKDDFAGIDPASLQVSFDGTTFQSYTAPVSITDHPVLYAIAADRAGNRATATPVHWFDIVQPEWYVRETGNQAPRSNRVTIVSPSEASVSNRDAPIKVESGHTYHTGLYLRGADIRTSVIVRALFYNDAGKQVAAVPLATLQNSFDWMPISGDIIAPTNATNLVLDMQMLGWGRVWLDDISVADTAVPDLNLAPDPSLEQTEQMPWKLNVTQGQSALLFRDTGIKHIGAQALLLSTGEALRGNHAWFLRDGRDTGLSVVGLRREAYIPASSGVSYSASAQARVWYGAAHIGLVFRDSEGNVLLHVDGSNVAGQVDWTPINVAAIAPSNTATLEIVLVASGEGRMWLSDVVLSNNT